MQQILELCARGVNSQAQDRMGEIVAQGYSPIDIVTTFFRVTKSHDKFGEAMQLDFIKVIGVTQMGVLNGVDSNLQLSAMVARLARIGLLASQQGR